MKTRENFFVFFFFFGKSCEQTFLLQMKFYLKKIVSFFFAFLFFSFNSFSFLHYLFLSFSFELFFPSLITIFVSSVSLQFHAQQYDKKKFINNLSHKSTTCRSLTYLLFMYKHIANFYHLLFLFYAVNENPCN